MRNKWTLLAFVAAIHVTYVVSRSLLGLLAIPIQRDTGIDDTSFGLLMASIFWTHAAIVPVAGWMGDRLDRIRLIACAALIWSMMTVLAGFATGFWSLLLLAAVAIIVPQTTFGPTACALLSDCHRETRSIALSCHQSAYYVGWFVSGAVVAGILSVWSGAWRPAFWGVGAAGGVVAVIFLSVFRSSRTLTAEKGGTTGRKPGFGESFRAFFSCSTARLLSVGYVVNIFVIFGYSSWAPKFVAEKFSLPSSVAGTGVMFWHYAASFASVLLTGLVTDRMVRRFPRVRLAFGAGAMLLAVPAVVGFGFAPSVRMTWVFAALLGFALGMFGSNMVSAVYDVVPARFRAGAVGFLNVLAAFVGSSAAVLLGVLSTRLGTFGFELGFALMGAATLLAAISYGAAAVFTFANDQIVMKGECEDDR